MSQYPSENSLTVNGTHQMLDRISSPDKVAATSPTRKMEKGLGYDVQFSFAKRTQFQYKRPQYKHSGYGLTFDVNGQQVGTLRFRDPKSVSYLACPAIKRRTQLADVIGECYFIDAQAVSVRTTLIHIPVGYDPDKTGGEQVRGHIPGEPKYEIPARSVRSWEDVAQGLNTRNIGMVVRKNGKPQDEYERFVERLDALRDIYQPSPYRTDGGEDEYTPEFNREAAERLINHAIDEYIEGYEQVESSYPGDLEQERQALYTILEERDEVRNRQTYRAGNARDVIAESGHRINPLELGYQ